MLLHAVDFHRHQEHFETIFIRNSKENNNFRGSEEKASQFKKSDFFKGNFFTNLAIKKCPAI